MWAQATEMLPWDELMDKSIHSTWSIVNSNAKTSSIDWSAQAVVTKRLPKVSDVTMDSTETVVKLKSMYVQGS
jgi:hypothetical protein